MAPFDGVIRFPEGTARFQILSDTTVLREVTVSANAPVVSNVSLGAGSVFNGVTAISWTGTDADGQSLTYSVLYDPDRANPSSEFEILATGLRDPRWTEDFSEIPGGSNAIVRIIATDGVLASSADSQPFTVPFKAPSVDIDPPAATSLPVGEELVLQADVADWQDTDIPDASMVWTSSVSGRLGSGPLLAVKNLPAGTHTITLTVTNSGGVSGQASVAITVTP